MFLEPQNRKDGEDLAAVLRRKGYQLVRTREEMLGAVSGKVWGLFAEQDISFDLDRPAAGTEHRGNDRQGHRRLESQ